MTLRRPFACLILATLCAAAAAGAAIPWASWFEKTTTVADKKTYVHILWDAAAQKERIAGKEKRSLLAEAARQLVLLRYPAGASADAVRVDIVFVAERDEYGNPKWDSLERVAHVELSRKKVAGAPSDADPEKLFEKFEVFP